MDRIDVANATRKTMPIAFARKVAYKTVGMLKDRRAIDPDAKVRISVAFIEREEIEKLNEAYLKKSSPTDVLSFCYEVKRDKIIGEVILCPGSDQGVCKKRWQRRNGRAKEKHCPWFASRIWFWTQRSNVHIAKINSKKNIKKWLVTRSLHKSFRNAISGLFSFFVVNKT